MHVFNTNLAAVGLSVCINKLSELPVLLSLQETSQLWDINEELFVEISLRKPVLLVIKKMTETSLRELELVSVAGEFLAVGLIELQGVKIGLHMTMSHVSSNKQHQFL